MKSNVLFTIFLLTIYGIIPVSASVTPSTEERCLSQEEMDLISILKDPCANEEEKALAFEELKALRHLPIKFNPFKADSQRIPK